MQVNDLLEPNVRIRELKKDRVNFVLENVDLAYVTQGPSQSFPHKLYSQLCELTSEGHDGRHSHCWCVYLSGHCV